MWYIINGKVDIMEKNYYDILEINRNASPEIIEKAYKTLVKKYHPDLQEDELKQEYEAKLKDINEAYEVLSDASKKELYDSKLKQEEEQVKQQDSWFYQEQNIHPNEPSQDEAFSQAEELARQQAIEQAQKQAEEQARQQALEQARYEQQMNQAINKAYHDAYIQDLKNRGYKIRYKKTFKDYIRGFISIIAVIVVLVFLWHIPFVHNFFINLYEENAIIHTAIDLISNIFK